MPRTSSIVSLAALLLASFPWSARASVVVKMELAELTSEADVIAHGTVTKQESVWEERRIVTRATLKVAGALKGTASAQLVIRSMGGVVDGIAQRVYGEPHYEPGEEVVIFLRGLGGGEYRTIGMAQGKFRLLTEGGKTRAAQGLDGLALARRPSQQPLQIQHEPGAELTATELFSKINELLLKGKAGAPAK